MDALDREQILINCRNINAECNGNAVIFTAVHELQYTDLKLRQRLEEALQSKGNFFLRSKIAKLEARLKHLHEQEVCELVRERDECKLIAMRCDRGLKDKIIEVEQLKNRIAAFQKVIDHTNKWGS